MTDTAWGHGLLTITDDGTVLDAWFPAPALGEPVDEAPPAELEALVGADDVRSVCREVRLVTADLRSAPADTADAYLRLHLLSHRLCPPNSIDLDGIFAVLPNVVWTSQGPCAVEGFERTRARMRARATVQVLGVDKFPQMTDYVVPSGVRIADASRVRLGAHLASGTTVTLPDGTIAKARDLSGQSNLLFLRNSVNGAVEARPRDGHGIVLNSAL